MARSAPAVRPDAAAGPSPSAGASVGAGRAFSSPEPEPGPRASATAAATRLSKLSLAATSAFSASSRPRRCSSVARFASSFTSLRWSRSSVRTPSSSVVFSLRASACFLCSSARRLAVSSSFSKCASRFAAPSRADRSVSADFAAAASDAAARSVAAARSRRAAAASRLAASSALALFSVSADADLRLARSSSDFFESSARSHSLCCCINAASCSMRALADSNAEHLPFASRSWLSARERSSLADTTLARYDSMVAFLSAISAFFCSRRSTSSRRDAFASASSAWRVGGQGAGEGSGKGGWRGDGGGAGSGVAGRRARSRASGGGGREKRARRVRDEGIDRPRRSIAP